MSYIEEQIAKRLQEHPMPKKETKPTTSEAAKARQHAALQVEVAKQFNHLKK